MPDQDKWTARRGSQGDDWRWEGEAPPEPDEPISSTGTGSLFEEASEKPARRLPTIPLATIIGAVGAFFVAAAALAVRPFRQLWTRATERKARADGQDFTRFAAILGAFTLIAAVALLILVLASVLGDDDDDATGPPTDTPTESSDPSGAPSATATASQDTTPQPTATATTGTLVPPDPEGEISLGLWANELDAWWFGTLAKDSAIYHPGDEVPWLLRWEAEPGMTYVVEITYECLADDIPLIELLTGVEYAHAGIFEAEWGPGSTLPEAAVPVPDTADSEIDDVAPGLLYLYGAEFTLLPDGPDPASSCTDVRTITVPVEVTDDVVILMGSAWLAHPDDHDGAGAADANGTIILRAEVQGVGSAEAGVIPAVITP